MHTAGRLKGEPPHRGIIVLFAYYFPAAESTLAAKSFPTIFAMLS